MVVVVCEVEFRGGGRGGRRDGKGRKGWVVVGWLVSDWVEWGTPQTLHLTLLPYAPLCSCFPFHLCSSFWPLLGHMCHRPFFALVSRALCLFLFAPCHPLHILPPDAIFSLPPSLHPLPLPSHSSLSSHLQDQRRIIFRIMVEIAKTYKSTRQQKQEWKETTHDKGK